MSTFNYKLRSDKGNSPIIYIIFSYGRKKLYRVSTGFTLKSEDNWNPQNQKIKKRKEEVHGKSWNKTLSRLKIYFEDEYDRLLDKGGLVSNDELSIIFNSFENTAVATLQKKQFDIILLFDEWISYCEFEKRNKGDKLSLGTIKTYKNTKAVFEDFLKVNRLSSEGEVNRDLYYRLVTFLEQKDYSLNYSGKVIKNVKSFLKYLVFTGKLELPSFRSEEWEVMKEDVDDVYLSNEELGKIYFYDLSSVEEKYRIARDLFLISAFTGLRISDNKRLKDENIVEDSGSRFFKIESKKTKTELIIPISNIVEEILSRNNGLPKSMADQTVNILIKEIGEWVGLDQVVYISRTKGGEKTSVKHMKYELIKTHTARMT